VERNPGMNSFKTSRKLMWFLNQSHIKKQLLAEIQKKWKQAMNVEMSSLMEMQVWESCELPKGKNLVTCKWVFYAKTE